MTNDPKLCQGMADSLDARNVVFSLVGCAQSGRPPKSEELAINLNSCDKFCTQLCHF